MNFLAESVRILNREMLRKSAEEASQLRSELETQKEELLKHIRAQFEDEVAQGRKREDQERG